MSMYHGYVCELKLNVSRACDFLLKNPDIVLAIQKSDSEYRKQMHIYFRTRGLESISVRDRTWPTPDDEDDDGLKGVVFKCDCGYRSFTRARDLCFDCDDPDGPPETYMTFRCERCEWQDADYQFDLGESDRFEERTFRGVYKNNTVLVGLYFSKYPCKFSDRDARVELEVFKEDIKWLQVPRPLISRHRWKALSETLPALSLFDDRAWKVVRANIRHNNEHGVLSSSGRLAVPLRPLNLIGSFM
jgi:hypothetical protein